jgi:alkylresorcinol/alkylpyrone synthase
MPKIISMSTYLPPYQMNQVTTMEFAKELFQDSYHDIDRLLSVFQNGQIENRYFSAPIEWFQTDHTFKEKNDLYISCATEFGVEAIKRCMKNEEFLQKPIDYTEIDAIFLISSSGISTPSLDARIMNHLPLSPHVKRIPIWGLGCAGGAAGLSRAYEYCLAFPEAKVLVLSIELCSLTFQRNDTSKSNLVGTSLFADGVACALLVGDKTEIESNSRMDALPNIKATQSTLMPHSEDVMGWEIKNDGLYVVFSKDIPHIVEGWCKPLVEQFLAENELTMDQIECMIAHPGGKKVLEAYQSSLGFSSEMLEVSLDILKRYGNMSSATVLFVLEEFMKKTIEKNTLGLISALGPGFSSELLLVEWD